MTIVPQPNERRVSMVRWRTAPMELAALGLVIMEDPKGIQPIYAPTLIIRADTLAQYPRIKDVLAPVFRSLDTPTLQALNAKVALEGQDAKQVSGAYLKSRGFIK